MVTVLKIFVNKKIERNGKRNELWQNTTYPSKGERIRQNYRQKKQRFSKEKKDDFFLYRQKSREKDIFLN